MGQPSQRAPLPPPNVGIVTPESQHMGTPMAAVSDNIFLVPTNKFLELYSKKLQQFRVIFSYISYSVRPTQMKIIEIQQTIVK